MEVLKYRKDANSAWQDVVAIVGPQGEAGKDGAQGPAGKDGVDGKDYILTDTDKQEIANLVLAAIASSEDVNY